MTYRKFLLILVLIFIAGEGLNVQALTITNVSVNPNPFSPNDDGFKDTTTISFVLSDNLDEIDSIIVAFDSIGNLEIEDISSGENRYIWDGKLNNELLSEGVYPFKITALDAEAYGSVIIDTSPPKIKNVFVSLSPFSPNSDGINDITEISFDLYRTNPPGFVDTTIETVTFSSEQSSYPLNYLDLSPFGAYLKVIPGNISSSTDEIKFTVNGGYKGALVRNEFTVSSNSGIKAGEELFDTISSISDVSGTTDGDSIVLKWFTGNAVVKMYSNDGGHIQTLNVEPVYIGDRNNYHVRWEPVNMSDGMYTYRILAEDGTGNIGQSSGQIIISNSTIEIGEHSSSPPRISPENEDVQFDQASITYSISKSAIVTVKVFDYYDSLIKVLRNESRQEAGIQNIAWNGTNSDGDIVSKGKEETYTYIITAMDSLTSETVKVSGDIVVDNKSPQPPQLASVPSYTNKDSITLKGTAVPDTSIQFFAGDSSALLEEMVFVEEIPASENITGKFSVSISLSEGKNIFTAIALDSVANKSEKSNSVEIILDKTPPFTTIEGNIPKGWHNEVTVNLEAVDKSGSGVLATYYTTDGSTPTISSKKLAPDSSQITISEDGIHLLKFFSQDKAGNIESIKSAADYIRIDTTPPNLEVTSVETPLGISSDSREEFLNVPIVIVSGTAEDEDSGVRIVEIQITAEGESSSEESWLVANGTTNWLYSLIPDVILPSYDLHFRTTDNAGNSYYKRNFTVELDELEQSSELTAIAISRGRIRLTWANSEEEYNIYRANYSGFVPKDEKNLVASGIDGGVWIDSNTTNQTEYYYKIGKNALSARKSPEEVSAIADKTPPAIENVSVVPNPFSPDNDGIDDTTTISFTLTEKTFVNLKIYDVNAVDELETDNSDNTELKQLVYDVLPAGDNLVKWDGKDSDGYVVDGGTYVYIFEKASTLDTAGNTLSQNISGTVTCIPVMPLEVKILGAQPNPFSPDGDKINDWVNLDYTTSDFADYVVVNIFDTSSSEQKVIARLKTEALEYYFDVEDSEWKPIHLKDGIPPGRSDENYYLEPVDTKNPSPPPFGVLNKPENAQTIDEYLAFYQATYPNWRPVPFTIQWNGQGTTEKGAYVYSLTAAQYSGISSVSKTGVINIEGIAVVSDDKAPPNVLRTFPDTGTNEEGKISVYSTQLKFVSADLDDGNGIGVDLTNSTIRLIGPNGIVPGSQSNDGINTITWAFSSPLADDGSDDGIYTISVHPVDYSKNRTLNKLTFEFEYNMKINDKIPPEVSNATIELDSGRKISVNPESVTTVKRSQPQEDINIKQIQVTLTDTGPTGINLSASSIEFLDYTDTLVPSEKKETPIDKSKGKLLLRNLPSLTDGRYKLRIQPVDNADNEGKITEYILRYQTVVDTEPPEISSDIFAFASDTEDSSFVLNQGDFISLPIYSLKVDVKDKAPSSGINLTEIVRNTELANNLENLSSESTRIQLLDSKGEEVEGSVSYENQSLTQDGDFTAKINFTLENPLSKDGSDDGDYTIKIEVIDNSENTSETSIEFKYDTIVPNVEDIIISSEKNILNSFPQVSVLLEDNPNGSGIDEDASAINIFSPDGNRIPVVKKEVNKEGEIIIEPPESSFVVSDGQYTIVVVPKDNAGNEGEEVSENFIVDIHLPSVVSMIPERGSSINSELDSVQITFYDENGLDFEHPETELKVILPPESAISERTLESKIVSAEDSEDSLVIELSVPLSINGIYTIQGKVADKAGNLQELEEVTPPLSFTFDTEAPIIGSFLAVSDTDEIELSQGKIIYDILYAVRTEVSDLTSGIDLKNSKILLKDESEKIVPGALHFQQSEKTVIEWILNDAEKIEPGVYKLEAELTDKAGNTVQKEISFGISTVHQFKPEIVSIMPAAGERFNTPISKVTVEVKDNSETGINFQESDIKITGPGISDEDYISNNGVDKFSWNFASPLAVDHSNDGTYTVKVEVRDNASNYTEKDTKFIYDTMPPDIRIDSKPHIPLEPGVLTNTSELRLFSVILKDAAGIDLEESKIELEPPIPEESRKTREKENQKLAVYFSPLKNDGSDDGLYEIRIYPKDRLGNAPKEPLIYSFVLDTIPPSVKSTEPSDDSILVNKRLFKVKTTLDDGQNSSGVDLSESNIKLTGPKGGIAGKKQINSNILSFQLNEPLDLTGKDDGNYTIEVVAVDKAGNSAEPFFSNFIYDTIQPEGPKLTQLSALPVSFSPNGDGNSDTIHISFTLSQKAKVTVEVYEGRVETEDRNIQKANRSQQLAVQPVSILLYSKEMEEGKNTLIWDGKSDSRDVLSDGIYTVMFDSVDVHGLTGAMESIQIFIDTQPPIISNLSVSNNPFTPDGDGFADSTSISFSVTNSTPKDNITVEIYSVLTGDLISRLKVEPDFAGDGRYSATWDGSSAKHDGEYSYQISAKDLAENTRIISGTVVLDKEAPFIDVESESQIVTNQAPLFINGTASDFSGVSNIEVLVDTTSESPDIGQRLSVSRIWRRVMFSGDGIDNDLDNRLDEEVYNQKDDDGDGKIDEDLKAQSSVEEPVYWIYKFEPKTDDKYILSFRTEDSVGHITREESDFVTVTVDYDTTPPKHLSTELFRDNSPSSVFKNDDEIKIVSSWDTSGYEVKVDISELDSQISEEISALDNEDGEYILKHQISPDNSVSDGLKTIHITASDKASNNTVVDIPVELDNKSPEIVSVEPVVPAYKNGDLVSLDIICDSPDYEVSADFSNVDSNYVQDSEEVVNNKDKSYTVKYQITETNVHPDGEHLPVIISVSDGINTKDRSFPVELDNTSPEFVSVSVQNRVLSNGESILLTVILDASGYRLLADFSDIDSEYTEGDETVTDNDNKTYTVEYTISKENTREDTKQVSVQFKAFDAVENSEEHNFPVILDNFAPSILKVSSQDEDTIYKNGDTVNLFIQSDAAGYKVEVDFSFLDSQYSTDTEDITDRGDGTYTVSYTISEENKKATQETVEEVPVIVSVSDESHTSVYEDFTLQLDNKQPTIEITTPSEDKTFVNTSRIEITGRTEALSNIKILPVPVERFYDENTGDFKFTVDLKRGENQITLRTVDVAGNQISKELSIVYYPIISKTVFRTLGREIILPEKVDDRIANNDTKIVIPAYALTEDTVVSIMYFQDELPPDNSPEIKQDNLTPLAAYRISLSSIDGKQIQSVLSKSAKLILQYQQPKADSANTNQKLAVFKWDGVNWNKLGGRIQENNTIVVEVNHISGLFAVFEIPKSPGVFKLYSPRPNPFTPNGDGINDAVTFFFENPQALETTVRIYDQRGALIRELIDVGKTSATWDGKDEDGKLMGLGLYIYQVKVGTDVKGGTVILAR